MRICKSQIILLHYFKLVNFQTVVEPNNDEQLFVVVAGYEIFGDALRHQTSLIRRMLK